MEPVTVRYIVEDVEEAVEFYTGRLGFEVVMRPAPGFALLSRGPLRLALSATNGAGGGSQETVAGAPAPGGWNRFQLRVEDLASRVAELEGAGVPFRSGIISGKGGNQTIVEDPSGNAVELFEPHER